MPQLSMGSTSFTAIPRMSFRRSSATGGGIILYDTGNFIDDYWKFPFRQTTTSFVFLLDIEDGRPARLRMVPVHIHSSPPDLATGKSFDAIRKRMTSLCATFGTPIIDTAAGLEVPMS